MCAGVYACPTDGSAENVCVCACALTHAHVRACVQAVNLDCHRILLLHLISPWVLPALTWSN